MQARTCMQERHMQTGGGIIEKNTAVTTTLTIVSLSSDESSSESSSGTDYANRPPDFQPRLKAKGRGPVSKPKEGRKIRLGGFYESNSDSSAESFAESDSEASAEGPDNAEEKSPPVKRILFSSSERSTESVCYRCCLYLCTILSSHTAPRSL